MKDRFIDFYMGIAEKTAELSRARRLQVGAIIVKEDRIISLGFNGTPSGWDNDCENIEWMHGDAGGWLHPEEMCQLWPYEGTYIDDEGQEVQSRYRLKTKPEVLHAEMNALTKVARSTESSDGATLFCTHAPCIECAKGIYQSGIKNVYYRQQYRSTEGIEFLKKCKIDIKQV